MKCEEPFDPETIGLEALEERIRDVQEEAFAMRKLLEYPAWLILAKATRDNAIGLRLAKTGKAMACVDEALAHNYHCGIADGLDRSTNLPAEIAETIEQHLEELRKLLKEKEDAKNADDTAESRRTGEQLELDTSGQHTDPSANLANGDPGLERAP